MNSTDQITIGEVAKQAGIQASALRYYESIGLIPAPSRVNGRRQFDAAVLQRLAVIQLAKNAGFTIAEIQTLLHGFEPDTPPSARWRALAVEKLSEVDALIRRAEAMKQLLQAGLDCGCLRFEDCTIIEGVGCSDAVECCEPVGQARIECK